eukprot:m.242911 g.242911  ORF g.242911 m.242911 type:complete len:194 (-) comp14121_c0_seq1:64-645(-)
MAAFELLMNSPSKDFVNQLFQTAFSCLNTEIPTDIVSKAAEALSVDVPSSKGLFAAISGLIRVVIFESINSKEALAGVLPAELNPKLKSLINSVIAANLPSWLQLTINSQVSLPRLKTFDWRIDIKAASDACPQMSVPTCIVQMRVQDVADKVGVMPGQSTVTFEVTKETLSTMLDGLGKIRDQLASVAGSSQ